jgi:hypothetical protein
MNILNTVELMLGDLSDVVAEWEQLPEGERVAWSIDWDNEMAGLERLSRYAACGVLTADQYTRYRRLLLELGEVAPVILRLQLKWPSMLRDR